MQTLCVGRENVEPWKTQANAVVDDVSSTGESPNSHWISGGAVGEIVGQMAVLAEAMQLTETISSS